MLALLEKRINEMATFKQRFNALKLEKGVNLKDIAKVLGVTEGTVSFIANGRVNINRDKLKILADYFDVDQAYLLGESEIRRKDIDDIINNAYIHVIESAKLKNITPEKLKRIIDAL